MIELLVAVTLLLPHVPGRVNPDVRQSTIATTICKPGWSSDHRPPVSKTAPIKRQLLKAQHLPGTVHDYQLDHAISIELGGALLSLKNLWMQPLALARRDDKLENRWRRDVCAHPARLTLAQARYAEVAFKKAHG